MPTFRTLFSAKSLMLEYRKPAPSGCRASIAAASGPLLLQPTSNLARRMDLNGKTLLVSGATGSFGTRFIERVRAEQEPKAIRVFSRDELKQSEMQRRFADEDR